MSSFPHPQPIKWESRAQQPLVFKFGFRANPATSLTPTPPIWFFVCLFVFIQIAKKETDQIQRDQLKSQRVYGSQLLLHLMASRKLLHIAARDLFRCKVVPPGPLLQIYYVMNTAFTRNHRVGAPEAGTAQSRLNQCQLTLNSCTPAPERMHRHACCFVSRAEEEEEESPCQSLRKAKRISLGGLLGPLPQVTKKGGKVLISSHQRAMQHQLPASCTLTQFCNSCIFPRCQPLEGDEGRQTAKETS